MSNVATHFIFYIYFLLLKRHELIFTESRRFIKCTTFFSITVILCNCIISLEIIVRFLNKSKKLTTQIFGVFFLHRLR